MTSSPASNLAVSSPITAADEGQASGGSNPVRRIFQNYVVVPVLDLLRMGASPRRLAWSLAVGVAIGINPIVGSTTLLCLAVAFVFRLNLIASQIANHLAFPIQLALVMFYIRAGEILFHTGPPPVATHGLLHAMRRHPWSTAHILWTWEWHGIIVWLLAAAVLVPLLAAMLCPLLTRLLVSTRREPAARI